MDFAELLSFRKLITPTVIQILYYIGLISVGLGALGLLLGSFATGSIVGILAGLIGAVLFLALGVISVRVYCEILLLVFKIYDELKAIRTGTPPPGDAVGFPVDPTPTPSPVTPVAPAT